jgi:glycosyltransferase involved in cell wall biosynthesis
MYAYPLFNPACKETFGGAEIQLFNLATEMVKKTNFDVSFIVRDFGQRNIERYGNIQVFKAFKFGKLPIYRGIKQVIDFVRTLVSTKSDLFIQRAAGVETGLIAIFCKFTGKKFIYMSASEIDVDGRYIINNPLWGRIYLLGIKLAELVVVQNVEHQKILFKRYGIKSQVVKNSFNIPKSLPDFDQKKFVLWVGSAQSLKRPEVYINLARHNPNLKFVMIMPEHDSKLSLDIRDKAKNIKNLRLIDRVPYSRISTYYRRATLLVNTSVFEGFPNTFVQAASFATPILSLKVNPDGFLDKYHCGYCCNDDIVLLDKLLKLMLKNRDRRMRMAINAYNYATSTHDIKANTARFIQMMNGGN